MARKLTDIAIRNAKPRAQRYEVSDGGHEPRLIVQPSGHKSFAVRYRDRNGTPCKLTLGSPPALSLAMARKAAADVLLEVARGNDPAKARTDAKIKAAAAVPDTVASIALEYMRREGDKRRTADQRTSALRRLILPVLGERPVETIKRSDVIRLLDGIEDKNGPRAAHAALALLRRILHFHELRSDEFKSPIIKGMGRVNEKERARSRTLDDDEIRRVWNATSDLVDPFSALIRFLFYTACRRGEASALRDGEIDHDGIWTLPASRSKTGAEVIRPLSKAALDLLAARPRIEGCDFVFTGNGLTPYANFSRPKAALDAKSGVGGYRLHDIRRTARSLLSRTGVSVDIAERCLGHAMPGVRGVYDRHKYVDEMRHAFEALGALIERIVHPPEGDVIPLRGRGR